MPYFQPFVSSADKVIAGPIGVHVSNSHSRTSATAAPAARGVSSTRRGDHVVRYLPV